MRHAYNRMKETFYLGDKVKFRPDFQLSGEDGGQLTDVPVMLNDQIYQATDYVAFNQGIAVGTLRLVSSSVAASELAFDADDIVVLHTPLADITPVAGIISEQFSTPLSHVSLRAHAWEFPASDCGERPRSCSRSTVPKFISKPKGENTRSAPQPMRKSRRGRRRSRSISNFRRRSHDCPLGDTQPDDREGRRRLWHQGGKSGGDCRRPATGFEVPPGFGVPFFYYDAHLKAGGIGSQITAMLADPVFAQEPSVRKQKLAELRQAIVDAPVSDELRAKVNEALKALPGAEGGVFVRSSTNAEDLPEFNGAGLYDTIPNLHGTEDVLGAIKQVWASVWNFAAYEERQRAGIDHAKVYGGSFVEVGVPAVAAGVLVTQHPTDPTDKKNYTINAKSGLGMAVVDGKKVPESLIVSWYNHGIRVLSRSAEDTMLVFDSKGGVREVENPNKGKSVLTNAMAITLADTAKRLTRLFKNNRLDIEWVFANEKLYIVQTRPLVQ